MQPNSFYKFPNTTLQNKKHGGTSEEQIVHRNGQLAMNIYKDMKI